MRKLGIPTVIDRTIQPAVAQQLMLIYEPLIKRYLKSGVREEGVVMATEEGSPQQNVYLETMEETKNKEEDSSQV